MNYNEYEDINDQSLDFWMCWECEDIIYTNTKYLKGQESDPDSIVMYTGADMECTPIKFYYICPKCFEDIDKE